LLLLSLLECVNVYACWNHDRVMQIMCERVCVVSEKWRMHKAGS
jgi:hypothetical protein